MALWPKTRRSTPIKVIIMKYTTPIKMGTVTLEMTRASRTHARLTGSSILGATSEAMIRLIPRAPVICAPRTRPRQNNNTPRTRNAGPTVKPNLRPSDAVSRAEIFSANLPFPPILAEQFCPAKRAREPGSLSGSA